jgi:hypothetical protein
LVERFLTQRNMDWSAKMQVMVQFFDEHGMACNAHQLRIPVEVPAAAGVTRTAVREALSVPRLRDPAERVEGPPLRP